MDLGFLSNFAVSNEEEEFSKSKKDVLKLLDMIGVDTRFVSCFESEFDFKNNFDRNNDNLNGDLSNDLDGNLSNNEGNDLNEVVKLYIENIRFSKFSKKRIDIFHKYYPDIDVVRSSLFQKICSRSSKTLANDLKPKDRIVVPEISDEYSKLLYIVLEPYSRKYGIEFVFYDKNKENFDFDSISGFVSVLDLNQEVNHILTDIFSGIGINWRRKYDEVYDLFLNDFGDADKESILDKKVVFPFINVPQEWINDFIGFNKEYEVDYDNDDIANSFMGFLTDINPQFKENVLAASSFLEDNQK